MSKKRTKTFRHKIIKWQRRSFWWERMLWPIYTISNNRWWAHYVWWTRSTWLYFASTNIRRRRNSIWWARWRWVSSATMSGPQPSNLSVKGNWRQLFIHQEELKVSVWLGLTPNQMHAVNSVFGTAAGPESAQVAFLKVQGLRSRQSNNRLLIKTWLIKRSA